MQLRGMITTLKQEHGEFKVPSKLKEETLAADALYHSINGMIRFLTTLSATLHERKLCVESERLTVTKAEIKRQV